MRAFDAYKILDEQEAGSLIDLIAPCMDDYLYIIDLKNDTLRISQSAVERFMLPDKFMNDATKHLRTLVYEKDRKLLENHKRKIYDGKEKRYNVLCRLMNSKNIVVPKLVPIINSSIPLIRESAKFTMRDETIEIHREIADAIAAHDAVRAHDAMYLHLIYNRKHIKSIN